MTFPVRFLENALDAEGGDLVREEVVDECRLGSRIDGALPLIPVLIRAIGSALFHSLRPVSTGWQNCDSPAVGVEWVSPQPLAEEQA